MSEDQFLTDLVSRVEQSRFSFTSQTEEFRYLNSNLQTYLIDIKRIDDDNLQLQENIDQIRTDYILTLESHLKRLPEDFRQESNVLTEAHLERYKFKSRAKRFVTEREELKKRIHFLTNTDKEQVKRRTHLQKQEQRNGNELKILNEQIQNLHQYVQTEKQAHQQAMDNVDHLQVQLEQVCIERSKREFEIQSLREEVKLMQTAKEFLDEEYQTILSTQTEANEYFLSRLNDSISRIREDFDQLNKSQLKQMENEYQQSMKNFEENILTNETIDETMITRRMEYEQLQNEYQSMNQELMTLNSQNDILIDRVLAMETDLYSIRGERMKELINKDKEFERNQIELQTLNDKLNYLVEYDRNLKFELTLYRGVLESEYQRKQQARQNQQPIRPAILRTTTNRSEKKSAKNLINLTQLEPVVEKTSNQLDKVISIHNYPADGTIENQDEVDRQEKLEMKEFPSLTVPEDRVSPTIPSTSGESSLDLPTNQSAASDTSQSSTTSSELQQLPEFISDSRQTLTDIPSASDLELTSEIQDSSTARDYSENEPISAEVHQTVTEDQTSSIPPPSTILDDQQLSSSQLAEREESADTPQSPHISPTEKPVLPETSQEDQSISLETPQSFVIDENVQKRFSSETVDEHQTITPIEDVDNSAEVSSQYDNLVEDQRRSSQSFELSTVNNQSTLEENQTATEELISSSGQTETEKENRIESTSSADFYGTINDASHTIFEELTTQSSPQTSFIDVGEVGSTASPKTEKDDSDATIPSNLMAVIQDLRYVYCTLANNDGLIEINTNFPNHLIDRLEFDDNLIRTLFDSLLKKYLVQPVQTKSRSATLDWVEFRDLLFPILTGRYTEGHLRKLFDLFDINHTGYLSLEELTELLELLQVDHFNQIAQNITQENEKLNLHELIETIRTSDDLKNNLLSEEIEFEQWYIQHPIDEETNDDQSFTTELPSPTKTSNEVILLSRIFRRIGADFDNRQLDCTKPSLSMRLTNEFIHNNIQISKNDLQTFIELFFAKKQISDHLINWVEFRDVFLPLINGGMISKDDLARWFDIFDIEDKEKISSEQVLHLFRLLQISNPEDLLNRMYDFLPEKGDSWTLRKLIFSLENIDQTTSRLLSTNEHIISFDLSWLRKNIF